MRAEVDSEFGVVEALWLKVEVVWKADNAGLSIAQDETSEKEKMIVEDQTEIFVRGLVNAAVLFPDEEVDLGA